MWTDRFGKEIKPGDYLAYAVAAGRGSGWLEIGLALKYYDSGALGVITTKNTWRSKNDGTSFVER